MKIEEIWKLLDEDNSSISSGYLTRRILPDVNYDIYLAVEKPLNTRILMFRVSRSLLEKKMDYPSSKSFVVNRLIFPQNHDTYGFLQLSLKNTKYQDIFTALVQDILECLTSVNTEESAISTFIIRLKRWQIFLDQNSPDGLGELSQQGLYGELYFLRKILGLHFPFLKTIQCWTGPTGSHQDFQYSTCAFEIKTSSARQHQKLTISSELQLDTKNTEIIILFHLSLDIRKNIGETLPEIVSSVRSTIANDLEAKEEFENLLFKAGYLDIHAERYTQKGYTVRESNYFQILEDFPRIIESDLRNGVGDVRYTISVAECKKFLIPESEVINLIERE